MGCVGAPWNTSFLLAKRVSVEQMPLARNHPEEAHYRRARDYSQLIAHCLQLGAANVHGWSPQEEQLCRDIATQNHDITRIREAIRDGQDPLGSQFCALRSREARRKVGATYTPPDLVTRMVGWARRSPAPDRIVDPGTGSGRFLIAAGQAFPRAQLVGYEKDPLAAIIARANLAATGLGERSTVFVGDYRVANVATIAGPTLFIGNPPYVRHHELSRADKQWLSSSARELHVRSSQLSGLHVHFFVATAKSARPGDSCVFVTAAEWLDVNYGAVVRQLLLERLGIERLDVIDPRGQPFADADTTAVITCCRVGSRHSTVSFRRAHNVAATTLSGGIRVPRERMLQATQWSQLSRPPRLATENTVPLGELCRVHRGQVTGANKTWIAGPDTPTLPGCVLFPAITRARELFAADGTLQDPRGLRSVIDLPRNLDELDAKARLLVADFLKWAEQRGAHTAYIARHRSPWWSVRLRSPAPILATYMARRPPAFVRNYARAHHINIAHGLYPRRPMSPEALDNLASFLATSVSTDAGRTYAGGLTKFEPREMERLRIPVSLGMDT